MRQIVTLKGVAKSGKAFDANNQIIEGININLFNSFGEKMGQFMTNYNAVYQSTGLPNNTYCMTTSSNGLWVDIKC